jgi:hypothetical protein
MNTVTTANANCILVGAGLLPKGGEDFFNAREEQITRLLKLDRKGGVQDIRRGHALMHIAGFFSNIFCDVG